QRALNELWPLTGQLFSAQPGDEILMAAGYWPDFDEMKQSWMSVVMPFLEQGELVVSDLVDGPVDRSEHSGHLNGLLADMQMVARADREAVW
ncbi:MAG: phenylacetate-CoA oxygenase subunit PaaI, partial [Anaerolineae bacterium]|nr:phenylacetate-CoA oxygenase subunit PaaI [Anaerolineae bacterium]